MSLFSTAGKTDVGIKRSNNEDAFHLSVRSDVCVVADGMGGAAAGELASKLFVEAAQTALENDRYGNEQEAVELVKRVFYEANNRILSHVAANAYHWGMGCTGELLLLREGGFVLGHVGDSRTYRMRDNRLTQLTHDHSLVQDQIDQGVITDAQARTHPYRNVISRAVGIDESLELDISKGKIRRGDVFLLCSDGLTDMVTDEVIERILLVGVPLHQKVDALIDKANSAGGKDNVTVVLAEVL